MKRLDEKEWKPIYISDNFEIVRGRENNMAILEDGDIPLISAKANNNGLKGFVHSPKEVITGRCITLNNDGDGGAGLAYYQPANMALDTHVTALMPRFDMSMFAMLFIAECISGLHGFFGHGLSISKPRAKRIRIMLPVTDSGEPNYDYMAQYASEMRECMLMRYKNYVAGQLSQLEYKDIPALNEKEWEHFLIPDIFSKIQRGKRLKNADHIPGETPYVSSTANNNGVDDYIEVSHETRVFKDCISLANSGSVGTAFYEPFDFVASDHVTALKTEGLSKYCYLFMTTVIEKQGSNFNFNREINDARIKNMQVMLPVTDSGEPDYEYMEQYAKNMMLRKYQQYLTFSQQCNDAR